MCWKPGSAANCRTKIWPGWPFQLKRSLSPSSLGAAGGAGGESTRKLRTALKRLWEPSLSVLELDAEGRYAETARLVGDGSLVVDRPFPVTVSLR